jgi:uncharacterized damage-inducible protein DinB
MAIDLVRELYDYHRWANRRLFDVAAGLGEDAVGRDVGPQFSYPTIRRMFAHLYGADALWLARWNETSLGAIPGADIQSLVDLRSRWDPLEQEQRAFVERLSAADLDRVIEYKNTQGQAFRVPLGPLLLHVANHATHHRSEVATMLTMVSGSPPDSGINTYEVLKSGQRV